jgi:hypothetical protein
MLKGLKELLQERQNIDHHSIRVGNQAKFRSRRERVGTYGEMSMPLN